MKISPYSKEVNLCNRNEALQEKNDPSFKQLEPTLNILALAMKSTPVLIDFDLHHSKFNPQPIGFSQHKRTMSIVIKTHKRQSIPPSKPGSTTKSIH
jgi:hypothetical protein